MGFFDDVTGGSLLSFGGNILSSFLGGSKVTNKSTRVPISQLVAEAKAAGLHPLAALGVTPTYETSHTVGDTPNVGQALAQFGQDVDRARSARMTPEERQMHNQQLKLAEAKTALVGQEIAESKARVAGMTPAAPIGGVANAGDVLGKSDASKVKVVLPEVQPHISPGVGGGLQERMYVEHSDGGVSTTTNEKLAEVQESDPGAWIEGIGRYIGKKFDHLLAQFGNDKAYSTIMREAPPVSPAMKKAGLVWRYNPRYERFYKVKVGSSAFDWYRKHFNY